MISAGLICSGFDYNKIIVILFQLETNKASNNTRHGLILLCQIWDVFKAADKAAKRWETGVQTNSFAHFGGRIQNASTSDCSLIESVLSRLRKWSKTVRDIRERCSLINTVHMKYLILTNLYLRSHRYLSSRRPVHASTTPSLQLPNDGTAQIKIQSQ